MSWAVVAAVTALIALTGIFAIVCIILQGLLKDDAIDLVDQAANQNAASLLDYLERSECNLYFNATLGAWGLMDGADKLVAAGPSLRNMLGRAREADAATRAEAA